MTNWHSTLRRRLLPVLACVLCVASIGWMPYADVPPDIVISQLHLFLSRTGDRVQVTEYYLLSNTGDEVFEGTDDPETGQRVTITFDVPEGADALTFDGPGLGERFVAVQDGFADTEPIPPGTASLGVLFSYDLQYREGLLIARSAPVPVASVVILAAEGGLGVEGAGVEPAGVLETEQGPALSYTAGPLAAGEMLSLVLFSAELPAVPPAAAGPSVPARNAGQEAAIGLSVLAVAVAGVYLLWRSRSPAGPPPEQVRPVVERIAALDARFEAGQVPESAYRKRRKSLVRQARKLLE